MPVHIVYTDTNSEHADNKRFLSDCSKWFGQEIEILRSEKYNDIWDVFEKTKYLAGVRGARCTVELKKNLRTKYQDPQGDLQVFGFDISEKKRAQRFMDNNPEVALWTPLIDKTLSKKDCLALLAKQKIELPEMYKLGYRNNNCIGCVKGQSGYWNKIRKDFPDVFNRMMEVEEKIGAAINKTYVKGKRIKVFLKDLPPNAGRYESEPDISCSIWCADASIDILNE